MPAPSFGGQIFIADRRWNLHVRRLAFVVRRVMRATGCGADVVLTNDRTVQRLNARDRGRNKPTNVLTYERPPEILLAIGVVRREAVAAGRSVVAHLMHLLVHGALHLAGYEHENIGQARRMEQAETRMLAQLGVKNPWKNR